MQQRDAWRLAALFLTALVVGTLLGRIQWCLLLAAVGYIIWMHAKLELLLSWMRDHKTHEPPEAPGAFEELSLEIDYLRERHKKRKKKLAEVKSAYSSGNPNSFNCCFNFFRLSSENFSAIGPLHAASGVSAPRLR